ncbi:MAG: N-acetylmuramoyl-L-alanine amidase [Eubacteriales bacterium]
MRRIIVCLFFALFLAFSSAFSVCALDGDKVVIVLDAGHGGYDGGTAVGLQSEKIYNLKIALYLRDCLEKDGRFKVIMTREDDVYLKFLPRALYALNNNADLFLSLHCNSNDYTGVRGSEAYITVVDEFSAYTLADKILTEIASAVDIPYGKVESCSDTGDALGIYYWNAEKQWDMPGESSLGLKSDYYSINTWCSKFGVPSIIVEHGYLSNAADAKIIDSDENLEKIAEAEAKALTEYYFGHTHSFSSERLVDHPSNCTLTGSASYRCSVCGAKTGTVYLDPMSDGHYWRISSSKAATCTEDGFIERVCQISFNLNDKGYECEVHSYTEELPAKGHDYVTLEDSSAGHGFDGLFYQKCSRCGDEIREVREGEPHNYVIQSETEADCTHDGVKTYACTICSDTYTEVTPALGHSYTERERSEPIGDEDGYVVYVCEICGEEKREVLSACEHEFEVTQTQPDCEKAGAIIKKCLKCGWEESEELPALGHDYVVQMEVRPGCESEGYKREKCSRCGRINTESYSATGHTFEYDSESGSYICRYCGAVQESGEDKPTRGLSDLLKSPMIMIILSVIVLQFILVVIILVRHRKSLKKKHDLSHSGDSN